MPDGDDKALEEYRKWAEAEYKRAQLKAPPTPQWGQYPEVDLGYTPYPKEPSLLTKVAEQADEDDRRLRGFLPKAVGVLEELAKETPFHPEYWKSPEERARLKQLQFLEDYARTRGIEDPRAWAERLMATPREEEITMGAYEPEIARERLPELPSYGVGERVTPGERAIGEWGMPMAVLAPLPPAIAGWRAAATLPTAAKVAARIPLAPLVAAEKAIGLPFKAVGKIMPAIQELIDANFVPNLARKVGEKVANIPLAGRLFKSLAPMSTVKTQAERGTIAWMGLQDAAPSFARIEMDAVYAKGIPFKFAKVTNKVTNVIPKKPAYSPYIQDIASHPDRYLLSKGQRAELDLLDTILKEQLVRELTAGVKLRPLKLAKGERYFPRFIQEVQDLATKAITEIKRGAVGRRPGAKPGVFRTRYYEEVLDGVLKGKNYGADYRAAVEMRLRVGNKAIADKMLEDFLKPFGEIPLERIPTAIRTRAWASAREYAGIRHFQKVVNRALRGEKLTEMTLKAQERRFPELGIALREGIGKPKELKALLKQAKALEPELRESYWAARRLAVKAMAQARVPILGKEGTINHAGLQGRLFPIEIADPTNAIIRGEITPHQVLNQIAKVNAVARMGQTAIDTGFTLIQGLLTLVNHPKAWGRAFAQSMKTLVNPKYTAKWNAIPEHAATRLKIARSGGAPFGSTEFTEAARAGGWLEKIPFTRKEWPVISKIFKRFGAAFEDNIDTARTLILEAREPHYIAKLGRALTPVELTDLVVSIDHMVGIGSLRRLGVSGYTRSLATNALYAPRYYLAFVSFLGKAFQGGIGGDLARKSLAKLMVAIPAFMSGVAMALGQQDRLIPTTEEPIPKMFDPRTGEFMTVEIAGTHMGLGGVYIAGFRLLGSLIRTALDDPKNFLSIDPHENPILRYGYGRASPVASAAIDVVTGANYLGERLDTPMDYLREVVDKTFPFWLAGQITDVPKAGWEKGMAEWWGLRAWMVQYRELAQRAAEDHIKDIPPEMIMPEQRTQLEGGKPLTYQDLNNEQRAWLLNQFADYRELEEKRIDQKLERGTDFQVMDGWVREQLNAVYEADLRDIATGVFDGGITIADYQEQSEYLRRIRQGQYQYRELAAQKWDEERLERLDKWLEENELPEDKAYDKYMEFRGNPPKVAGKPDWEVWERQLKGYLNTLSPEVRAYIERRRDDWIANLPIEVQPIERLLLECEAVLDDYYQQPLGKARIQWRTSFPEVDAKLFMSGRITTLKTRQAALIVEEMRERYGIPYATFEKPQAIPDALALKR